MSQRKDIHKVLIIGSGPIIIGQACEFDYSGTQACKALRNRTENPRVAGSIPALGTVRYKATKNRIWSISSVGRALDF